MSENFTVKKSMDIEMDIQIDYVECKECGQQLDFEVAVDNFGDLHISAEPHNCDDN